MSIFLVIFLNARKYINFNIFHILIVPVINFLFDESQKKSIGDRGGDPGAKMLKSVGATYRLYRPID